MKKETNKTEIKRIPKEAIEKLHQFIDRYGTHATKSIIDRARSPVSVLCKKDKRSGFVEDSILEEMYRDYISSCRKPALTFREYAKVIRTISDLI